MANERMYLLHEPSGYGVYMGKRMGWGWYDVPAILPHLIQHLHEIVELEAVGDEQDAYIVVLDGDRRLKTVVWEKDHHEPLGKHAGGENRNVPWLDG